MPESLASLTARYDNAETFVLGDSPALCEHLIRLVRQGRKTASTGAWRDFEQGEPMPMPGRTDIILDWSGNPALVLTKLRQRPQLFSRQYGFLQGAGGLRDLSRSAFPAAQSDR